MRVMKFWGSGLMPCCTALLHLVLMFMFKELMSKTVSTMLILDFTVPNYFRGYVSVISIHNCFLCGES